MIKLIKLLVRSFTFICLINLFLPVLADNSVQVQLLSARSAATNQKTRFVFVLSGQITYSVFSLQNPDRLVIDFNNTSLATTDLSQLNLVNTPIKDIRDAVHNGTGLRVVFDLKNPVQESDFLLPQNLISKTRLVIDLTNTNTTNNTGNNNNNSNNNANTNNSNSTAVSNAVTPLNNAQNTHNQTSSTITNSSTAAPINTNTSSANQTNTNPSNLPVVTTNSPSGATRNIVVVIDPGHGGKDPGATGPHGIHEKDVVLAISRDLQTRLNQIPGIHAYLTRTGDYFITLRGRLDIARKDKADLFVAIHADAYINNNSQGASVFALSETGATSEAARWLADRENYSELGGVQDFSDKSYLVRSVLLDLSQTVTITQSLQIGHMILGSLGQVTPLHHGVVEQARFVVLKSPDIPSLLIETGFITNPSEEARLSNPNYQEKLADAIAIGIEKYFWQNPPSGTLFAAKQQTRTYIVAKGDTLQSIADQYGINPSDITALNKLKGNQVQVGQALTIPMNTLV